MNEYIPILPSTLTGIADEVRRLGNLDGKVTTEQMKGVLSEVIPGVDLPDAEDGTFGVVEQAYEFGVLSRGSRASDYLKGTGGYKFIPNEDITVAGIWMKSLEKANAINWFHAGLWDDTGTLLASCYMQQFNSASQALFDVPVNLKAGKTYMVAGSSTKVDNCYPSGATFNSKITFVTSVFGSTTNLQSSTTITPPDTQNYWAFPAVDILIAPSEGEVSSEYTIQTATMNNIANEVIRITGGNTKLTPGQIITALQGIGV